MLEAINLTRAFGDVVAVQDFNLTLAAGEVVALLGPNGAGKTTALRMLAGILSPSRGEVRVGGIDFKTAPLKAKQRIGFLSGDTQLYQRLSAREVLQYFGRLYGMEGDVLRARVDALIKALDMTSFSSRPCGTLSSGQKQRANIARAFLHQPDVLILDEPTATLDIVSGQFIMEAIRRERAAGTAILLSTHIISEAEYLCDRIVLLHQGRIVDAGTLPELLERAECTNLTDAFLKHIGHMPSDGEAGT